MFSNPRFSKTVGLLAVCCVAASHSGAKDVGVDVALVIAGDVSGSMSQAELHLQRDGFATAFRHPDILNVIGSGPIGRIAVTYIEWGGQQEGWIVVPWAIITDRSDAAEFADQIEISPMKEGTQTSLSYGLLFAASQFRTVGVNAIRQTIDISGNGPNSSGPPVEEARDFVVDMGITINGLTFSGSTGYDAGPYAYLTNPDDLDLGRYYQDCVIGGAGGFAMSVDEPAEFMPVIRRKLVLEIAALPPLARYVDYRSTPASSVDCNDAAKN